MSPFLAQVKNFEGPLDLLLQLIEKDELDITQVSLAQVTDDYLAYVRELQEVNPDEVADFLVVAARLLLVKARAIMPSLTLTEEEEEDAAELENRLKAYKIAKHRADLLADLLTSTRQLFSRPFTMPAKIIFSPPPLFSVAQLNTHMRAVIADLPSADILRQDTIGPKVSLEEKIGFVRSLLDRISSLDFGEMQRQGASKTDVIVTFLAVLELMKRQSINVRQEQPFGTMSLSKSTT